MTNPKNVGYGENAQAIPEWAHNVRATDFYDASTSDKTINNKTGEFMSDDTWFYDYFEDGELKTKNVRFGTREDISLNGRFLTPRQHARRMYYNFLRDMRQIDRNFRRNPNNRNNSFAYVEQTIYIGRGVGVTHDI